MDGCCEHEKVPTCISLHKRSRLHFVRGSRVEAARVAEESKSHFEAGRCSDSNGFSARHSSRESMVITSSSEALEVDLNDPMIRSTCTCMI